ncbi:hypothetical protein [uncultured Microbacterium sp.]|uniref:Uncharacterized protein n=1 Tax=uncultured Microbacterium sp. TaxID=191216 RepID=A0A1Y5P2P5_9MICO|nr:hypothetical protein [uncultured Microbacterium sp.]SBS70361.1 conserved membrane hypothetical protein [uncultured Microbacterium sp.]
MTLRGVLTAIGWGTVGTGALQVVAPGFVLRAIGGADERSTRHLFGTVGMFMVVVGGLVVGTLRSASPDTAALGWGAAQKAGAAVAVGLGVARRVFSPIALLVAAFDAVTAVLLAVHRNRLR